MLAIKNERDGDGRILTLSPTPRKSTHPDLLNLAAARFTEGAGVVLLLVFAVFISGCAPPGPRALVAGRRLLDRGDYPGAVTQLKTATSLLATNAAAWNYYGVALQHDGQFADAALAYQNALRFDRDLVEAHYNLGCLWMEQDKPDAARTEFTAYTLRRNNTPEGWLKLGAAQLKLHDLHSAETSFSTALSLSPNNSEALNGLGLASIERDRPLDAAKFFSAAIQAHPDYAPAILNLATVEDEYLHDDSTALKNYLAYLALTPHPANWGAVSEFVSRLEQTPMMAKAAPTTVEEMAVPEKPGTFEAKPTASASAHMPAPPARSASPPAHPEPGTQVVAVQPEPAFASAPGATASEQNPETESQPETARHPGVAHRTTPVRWFASSTSVPGVTPLAPVNPSSAAPPPAAAPVKMAPPAPPVFPRYLYLSPRKPAAGDRKAASRAFAEAQQYERQDDLAQAVNSYRQAAELDPAWFEAQYNCAVLAYRVHDFAQALASSEMALAIRPDSEDARYIFAVELQAAGYEQDALNELKKIVAANPNDARAQLALGNLYAEQMRDLAQARQHYVKWLELDPHDPQADNIRYWLSANPQ